MEKIFGLFGMVVEFLLNYVGGFINTSKTKSYFRNLWIFSAALCVTPVFADLSISEYPLFLGSINKANVLLLMDNSNSMDEEPSGTTACSAVNQCGSASDESKSQIARAAAKSLIVTYTNKINLGLMAYQQSGIVARHLHNSPYDVSYNVNNYDATFSGARESSTKRNRMANPTSPGNYIYYNVALPFYDSVNQGNAFCYTRSASAIPFSNATIDTYRCFSSYTGTSDSIPPDNGSDAAAGYSGFLFQSGFAPTDSDYAQGIYDFGQRTTWNYVGPTWFSNSSPGKGYLHIPISLLDSTQASKLNTKLGRSQFTDNRPTNAAYPLQNAGLTPLEGTLISAKDYFISPATLPANQGGGQAALPESCGKNFVVMLTDGLPSTNVDGTTIANVTTGLDNVATAASNLRSSAAKVDTYVIGFALPYGTDPTTLDTIATAGGTSTAYSASDLTSLNASLGNIFTDILEKTGAASSVATNSTSVKTESRVYQAKFQAADWSGQLLQFKLNNLTTPEWDTGSKQVGNLKLNAQSATSRVIITKGASDGVPFRWSTTDLTSGQQSDLNENASGESDARGSDRLAYLRGDASNEAVAVGSFRPRESKLGDIVNSNPLYVGAPAAGYSDVDHPGYLAFRTSKLARKPVVYIGANDGMLHGVDASLDFTTVISGVPTSTAGNEVLAYVPSMVYSKLSKLTDQTYNQARNHVYFVDGSPMFADAYLNGAWHTVLSGGLGAGGKGVYALDITNPDSYAESAAADILLWEFTDLNDADMGYVYNHPASFESGQSKQIVKMENGKWAVLFGNGYNSTPTSNPGKAALFILFIQEGTDGTWSATDFKKIVVDASGNNGLSTPTPFDSNGDGLVDTVYAGDLKGNVWKILVGPGAGNESVTTETSTWMPAFSTLGCTTDCVPLYLARDESNNAQSITWPIEVTLHPQGGKMVLFGTGKYLEEADNASTRVQTFYGVRDMDAVVSGRGDLTPRSIATSTIDGNTFRITEPGCGVGSLPNCPTTSKGWYVDLPTSGERMTGIPKLASRKIIFNTFIPTAGACTSGGSGWLMALDYLTGSLPSTRVFDTNNDTYINNEDTIVGGIKVGAAIAGTTLIRNKSVNEPDVAVSSLATGELVAEAGSFFDKASRGRISWREIVQ